MLKPPSARRVLSRTILLPALILLLTAAAGASSQANDLVRTGGWPDMQTPAPTGRIVIKFAPGAGLVMTRDGIVARQADKTATAGRIEALVGRHVSGGKLEKRFPSAPANLDKTYRRGSELPDLALYAHVDAGTGDRTTLLRILAAFNADPAVAVAFLEPVAVPASLGFDAFTGAVPEPARSAGDKNRDSPDFESQQDYLGDAPDGIGALAVRSVPGARGAGVTIIDVEGAWLWAHEDLPDPVIDMGEHSENSAWRHHGTAVMGEMRGTDNGLGVTGITPDASVGNSSIFPTSTAQALAAAVDTLNPGDLILIELHGAGPNANGEGQFGYVPMEYWQDNFDVIKLATSKGILVCEAAGNGYQNLDDEVYQGLFDRSVRDSGAIMIGATAGGSLDPAEFSNNGSRVDLSGWGLYVVTCGYGDLRGDPLPEEQWYTEYFSGTSSASPIVTGAVASLQGMVRQELGFDLDARLARDLLRTTGTPTNGSQQIGPRPYLPPAFALAQTSIGEVIGTVSDAGGGQPIDGVEVKIVDQGGPVDGAFTATAGGGAWRLPLQVGPVTVRFTSFYYETLEVQVTVTAGATATLNVALTPQPLVDLAGVVSGGGQNLAGARVTPLVHPVGGATTDAGGNWVIADVPRGYVYELLFDGVPGYGARVMDADTDGDADTVVLRPVLAAISEDFEADGGGYSDVEDIWEHGQPPVEITGGAFSGDLCWGVGMDGPYIDNIGGRLQSPIYYTDGITSDSYYLSFHYLCDTEPGYDGVSVSLTNGGEFEVLQPLSGYTDLNLNGLGNRPGWSGDSGTWRGAVFDLTDKLGEFGFFMLAIDFGSDGGVTGNGFFLDGISFGEGLIVSPVPEDQTPRPYAARLEAWPNPFNPQLSLRYSLTRAAHLDVGVYDLRGRLVRKLLSAPVRDLTGVLVWDGADSGGRPAPSGVYLVRLQSRAGDLATRRVVLAK